MSEEEVDEQDLLRYLATLNGRHIAVNTMRQYLSGILWHLRMRGLELSAEGNVDRLLKGASNLRADEVGPAAIRPFWTASDIMRAIAALRADQSKTWLAGVISAFLFASRSATLDEVRLDHFARRECTLVFHEHCRKTRDARAIRQMEAPIDRCVAAAALAEHVEWRRQQGHGGDQALAPGGLQSAVATAVNELQVDSKLLQTHACRRGAAVSMHALRVEPRTILGWGAWASERSLRPYVAQQICRQPTPADEQIFGWLVGRP